MRSLYDSSLISRHRDSTITAEGKSHEDQIAKFPPMAVGAVYHLHRKGVAWLRARGLGAKQVPAPGFAAAFKADIRKQDEGFRRRPDCNDWVRHFSCTPKPDHIFHY